nr:hypothetical protein CFP56_18915 [Quercus suber]
MESEVLERIQNMMLTMDEDEVMPIRLVKREKILEEFSLNLIGKFLTTKPINIRAAQNLLRSMWKLRDELKIIEVGEGLLQFKFLMENQLRWGATLVGVSKSLWRLTAKPSTQTNPDNGKRPFSEWLKARTQARSTEPSKDQYHACRNQKPSSASPPPPKTEIPAETNTKKSASQAKINGSPRFANHYSRPINPTNASDLLPQLAVLRR